MKKNLIHCALIFTFLYLNGCKKDYSIPNSGNVIPKLTMKINYRVDGLPLIFDSLLYTNSAGNNYDVKRLEYYISNVTFHNVSGKDYYSDKIFYINAREIATNTLTFENIPEGDYNKLTLNIGLDSMHNISYYLPNTTENINMAWPDAMGGGYHFMKFEGDYMFQSTLQGYTMHLGRNQSLVSCIINNNFKISASSGIALSMNLNEWFKSPSTYDFNTDGYSIMANKAAQLKIAANGYNVFSIQ